MDFHYRHFPTFIRMWRATRAWYAGRDLFEKFIINFVATAAVVYAVYFFYFAAPAGFPAGAYVTVTSGETLAGITEDFQARQVVAHATLLKYSTRLLGNDRDIPAGVYYFPQSENTVEVAIRLVSGDFETTPVRVTIPEGDTVAQIADILEAKMPNFNKAAFLKATQGQEGYLFPDTYFFMPGDSTAEILAVFSNNFQSRIAKIQPQITSFGKPLPEVLAMASVLQKEANDTKDRQIIAGILWHRIQIGMPLEVDAPFAYILDKSANDLTSADLKTDSPYNTFTNKGLPPGPIDNPDLDSITDAVTPTKTNYVYYLSDSQGNFHYAVTYAQFLAYKAKYIRS